jgi:type VI secretion system secreted protein VgrG
MIQGVIRTAVVSTTLPEGELLFYAMRGYETLGRPFEYEVELLSENPNIGLSELLGQPLGVGLELPDGTFREFDGIVTHFSFTGAVGRYAAYRAVVRPRFWLFSQMVRSRIFQAKSVRQVIEKVFRESGFSDFAPPNLTTNYREFEYLVQYRESELDFLSRLMELEGIYYFFKHQDGKDTLVLADSVNAHHSAPGYDSVPYFPPQAGEQRERDHIDTWQVRRTIRPGIFAARDFNFTRPAAPIEKQARLGIDRACDEYEVYDYPGKFQDNAEAEAQVRVRLEERQADFELVQGEGNARGLGCGDLFTLTQFPRDDQNKEYLIVHAAYDIKVNDYESLGRPDQRPDFRVRFVAMDATRPYRAPRITRKPVVEGPQTATVVGQAGQEIWTDQYGRVRLQFHWDREGQSDEDSACWVRVSQAWAGAQWGSIHIPRIGQEVIVDFLEGDPDRPIVTGRVYNADHMPPYELPANQTQSGIKSRSTKGGTPDNFNEIRFEDKKGQEELHIQAEKNMTTLVKNDQSTTVKANRSAGVTGNDSVSVGGDRSLSVDGNLSVTVKGGGKGPTASNMDVTGKHNMHASDTIDMDAPTHIKLTVGGSSITIEPSMITISAGGGASVVFDANMLAKSSAGSRVQLDANACNQASGGAKVLLDGNVLAISSAGSQVVLDANAGTKTSGDVVIEGMNIQAKAQAEAKMACSGSSVGVNPAAAEVKAPMVNIAGQSMTSIGAGMIKIG